MVCSEEKKKVRRQYYIFNIRNKEYTQIDSKLKSKIERKKQAHGLKTDRSVQAGHNEDEEQGIHLSI